MSTTNLDELPGFVNLENVTDLIHAASDLHETLDDGRLALWLLEQVPATAELVTKLRQLAMDAGVSEDSWWANQGLAHNEKFDSLLNATGWQSPPEVLEPDFDERGDYEPLLSILEARLARASESERVQLEIVEAKLRPAVEDYRRRKATGPCSSTAGSTCSP